MPLLTTKTIITWQRANKKHYENLGYIYTKIGDSFTIKINDLPKGNNKIFVDIKCDNCNKKLHVSWQNYQKYKHTEKYYCNKCSNLLFGKEKREQTQLKKSKSFYDWCYENLDKEQADNIINRWDTKLNKYSPKDVCYNSNKKYWFKCIMCCNHKSEEKHINDFTNGHKGSLNCKQCNSFAQWGMDNINKDFLNKYWDYDKNDKLNINPWEISYGSRKKVYIKCQKKKLS
jgi:hypothetical protein